MNDNKTRIEYIDGLRGLASIQVLFSHLILAFYPVLHALSPLNLYNQPVIVKAIASTPLSVIYSGHFAVNLFFLLSGYAITYNYYRLRDESYIASSAFRRYFRLTIPALFSCVIAYLLLKFDLFFNIQCSPITQSGFLNIPYHFDADLINMFKFTLFDEYFQFQLETGYNNVLWVMQFLLFGSMLIYSFLAIFGKVNNKFLLYIILVAMFHRSFYLAFILGMILCDLDINELFQRVNSTILSLLLLISIYLSSFKTFNFVFYSILNINMINDHFGEGLAFGYNLASFNNIIGAFLLVFVVSRMSFLKNILSTKIPLYLGKISFSIYLLHLIVICSISSYLYIIWFNIFSYNLLFFITSIITILISIASSHLFYYCIEVRSINWSKSLYTYCIGDLQIWKKTS